MQNYLEEESQHCHTETIPFSLSYVVKVVFYVDDMHLNKTWNDLNQCERYTLVHDTLPCITYLHGELFSVYCVFRPWASIIAPVQVEL